MVYGERHIDNKLLNKTGKMVKKASGCDRGLEACHGIVIATRYNANNILYVWPPNVVWCRNGDWKLAGIRNNASCWFGTSVGCFVNGSHGYEMGAWFVNHPPVSSEIHIYANCRLLAPGCSKRPPFTPPT